MRRRVRWRDRSNGSFLDSRLRTVRKSSARLRRRLWSGSGRRFAKSRDGRKASASQSTIEELAPYMRGWRSYFGFCETPEVLISLTRWVRLRLRSALWRQWKTPRRRRAALLALRVSPRLARNTAGSGHGPWYLARSQALARGLSNAYFRSLGLPSLIEAR